MIRALAVASVLAASVCAQVFVVDAANGAGAHFTDLPAAVAAVPDGATLRVRAGDYTAFSLAAKGLVIVGEGVVTFSAGGTVAIGPTRADQVIVLRDLTLPRAGQVRIVDALGPVILERCHRDVGLTFASIVTDVVALRAANVQLLGCVFDQRFLGFSGDPPAAVDATDSVLSLAACRVLGNAALTPAFATRGNNGGIALALVRARAVLSHCTVVGGAGSPGCRSCGIGCSYDGGVGGAACRAENATVVLLASTLQGGVGGVRGCCSLSQQCTCPGNGGGGLALVSSAAFLLGQQPLGGAPGGTTCGAQAGAPVLYSGTNTVHSDATARPPLARIDGVQATGQNIAFTVLSPAGSVALLAIAYDGALLPIEPIGHGSLLASASGFVGPFTVPPGDLLQLPWPVPGTFAVGRVHFGQFLTLANGAIFASNPFPLLVAQ